jgi:hypothetical protein
MRHRQIRKESWLLDDLAILKSGGAAAFRTRASDVHLVRVITTNREQRLSCWREEAVNLALNATS